jgi:hypothetical protein
LSQSALLSLPKYADEVTKYDSRICDPKLYAEYPQNEKLFDRGFRETEFWRKMFPAIPENAGACEGWQKPEYDDSNWKSMMLPDSWTLVGYNHAGRNVVAVRISSAVSICTAERYRSIAGILNAKVL